MFALVKVLCMVPYYQQLHRPIIPRGKQNWLASLIQVTLVPLDIVHSVKKKKEEEEVEERPPKLPEIFK